MSNFSHIFKENHKSYFATLKWFEWFLIVSVIQMVTENLEDKKDEKRFCETTMMMIVITVVSIAVLKRKEDDGESMMTVS